MPAQVLEHDGFRELHLSGALRDDLLALRLDALKDVRRVLVDYSEVTDIQLPVDAIVQIARRNDEDGVRVAVYAPTPLAFGWNRQVLQLADAREGVTVSVFKDRAQAIAWLVSEGSGAAGFGGSWRLEPPLSARPA